MNAGNKKTTSTHHPRRRNLTPLMDGLKNGHIRKNLVQKGESQRYSLGTQKKKKKKKDKKNKKKNNKKNSSTETQIIMVPMMSITMMTVMTVHPWDGRVLLDNYTCLHTERKLAYQNCYITQPQHTNTKTSCSCTDPVTPGDW